MVYFLILCNYFILLFYFSSLICAIIVLENKIEIDKKHAPALVDSKLDIILDAPKSEIKDEENDDNNNSNDNESDDDSDDGDQPSATKFPGRVLICVKDEYSVLQVQQVLSAGSRTMLEYHWQNYLKTKQHIRQTAIHRDKPKQNI